MPERGIVLIYPNCRGEPCLPALMIHYVCYKGFEFKQCYCSFVAAISDRHLFCLQNQNNQTTITSLHQNQLKQVIYNVEPILQSFRLANTVRRYIICNNFPIFINFVLT